MTYTKEILISRLRSYKMFYNSAKLHKGIRKPNFPEDISENIVKFHLNYKTTWKSKTGGDLYSDRFGKIEIKCFSSDGPISFGPSERWNILYILDAREFQNDIFTIHKINLTSEGFKKVRVSKKQTFGEQILQKRRPRIPWKSLQNQITSHLESTKICLAND